MTDQSKPTISFAQLATSGTPGTSPFGQTSTTSGASSAGLFGSSSNPSATSGGALFGGTATSNSGGGVLFSIGTGTSQPSSLFGGAGTAGGAPSGRSSLFGEGNKPASGGISFGQASNNNPSGGSGVSSFALASSQSTQGGTAASSTAPFNFATPNKPSESSSGQTPKPSLFGSTASAGDGSLFNLGSSAPQTSTTTPTSKPTTSIFANSTTPAGPPPNTSGGAGSANPFNFAKPQSQAENLFGKAAPASAAPSLLGNTSQPPGNQPTTSANISSTPSSIFDTSSKSGSLFNNKGGTQQAGDLFNNINKPQDPSADMKANPFQLGGQTSATNTGGSSTSGLLSGATSTASAFSLGQKSASTFAPLTSPSTAPGGLSLGSQATTTTATTSAFNVPKAPDNTPAASGPSQSAPTTAPSLFANLGKSAAAGTSQPSSQDASKPATTTESQQPTNLTASTAGPPPPVQSRLKNKSMDEIITRWATDLSKYQKEFQAQAEKVAQWDRMLVENSDKIQRLYGQTLEAERATTEVERQLSAVENDQAELEAWLSHYEGEVDQMIKNQGGAEGGGGPDKEREHTYQLAARLSEKLDEMGKDLASMIEEINDASSTLSKNSKQDDPLSQVVRVLNSHLTQLQQIDQGAAALTLKVQEAQKAARTFGPARVGNGGGGGGLGGPSSEAADGFWRSYMGKR
ncbi:MAG: hypothetical protein Q9163_001253 [Psora crenata]